MEVPHGLAITLRWVSILLFLFAIVDVVLGRIFAIDITGVSWSAYVSGIAGSALLLFVEIIESKLAVGLTSEDEEGHKEVDAVVSQVLSDAVAGDQKKVRWSLFWFFWGAVCCFTKP